MDNALHGLVDRNVLIVGGGQGMGEASAICFARAGAHVAVADVAPARAERVSRGVQDLGRRSVAITGDVLNDAQALEMVAQAEAALGPLRAAVCIVGQASWNALLDMTDEQWEMDLRRNLRYFLIVGRAVARRLIERGEPGALVCIASVSGLQSAPNHAGYGAAKAGLLNLMRTMAVEWGPHQIRVNAIAPGDIATPRFPETDETRARSRQGFIPMQRRGTTEEVGKVAVFLASDLASYVTGVTVPLDGGWMAQSMTSFTGAPPARP